MMKKLILSVSTLALAIVPVAANAAPAGANSARSLSVAPAVRAGKSTAKSNKLAAGASIVPLLIGAGIIAGATYLIIDHENDDSDSN